MPSCFFSHNASDSSARSAAASAGSASFSSGLKPWPPPGRRTMRSRSRPSARANSVKLSTREPLTTNTNPPNPSRSIARAGVSKKGRFALVDRGHHEHRFGEIPAGKHLSVAKIQDRFVSGIGVMTDENALETGQDGVHAKGKGTSHRPCNLARCVTNPCPSVRPCLRLGK